MANRRTVKWSAVTLFLVAVVGVMYRYGPLLYVQHRIIDLNGMIVFDSPAVGGLGVDGPTTYGPTSSWWEALRILRMPVRMVVLNGASVTDESFPNLSVLDAFSELDLDGSDIGVKTLGRLASFSGLTLLTLNKTKIGDEAVQYLAAMQNIETLALDETKVSDAGLIQLAKISTLRRIVCRDTGVTGEGAQEARSRNPALVVTYD